MPSTTRREFLKRTTLGTVASSFVVAGTKSSGRVLGANDTVRVALAGCGGRGGAHLSSYLRFEGVDVVALIDPDTRQTERKSQHAADKNGGRHPECFQDLRHALENVEIDAVSIASTNHSHALLGIWSMQAGKDVYIEKPCSHNVFEGRKLVEAAQKYNRVCQHGTQQRSTPSRIRQIEAVHSGKYGKLLVSKGYCCKPRLNIKFAPTEQPPQQLDFDAWLGPAATQPYHKNLVHYNWHWFWDFGNGDMGNQGVHEMDVARWAIPGATLPKSVWSLGGRWVNSSDYQDQGQTPNMLMSIFDYGDTILLFETRGFVDAKLPGGAKKFPRQVANEYYTTEGKIYEDKFFPHGGGSPEKVEGISKSPPLNADLPAGEPFVGFINAVRHGKPEDVKATILDGHLSSALCHLGNISYRLGSRQPFSNKPELLGQNHRIDETFEMIQENLAGVGVELDKIEYQIGPMLNFDPRAEKFIGNEKANTLLTRNYREPYVVPEQV